MIDYCFMKELDTDFDSAVEMVKEHLHDAGFGILTTIDVKEEFAHKLGLELEDYVILGVCDPTMAQKAICAEQNIGLMLPSNVIVYEEAGKVLVAAVRPTVVMHLVDNLDLHRVARDIERRLKDFIESLQPTRVPS
jgi:uncharacterized protein (DUF302 family)